MRSVARAQSANGLIPWIEWTERMICGVDEAGRGPVLGPMVIAAVMIEDDSALREMGVKDSKKLTPAARERLATKIEGLSVIERRIVPAEEIDEAMRRMTLNEFEARVFASLLDRLRPDIAYVDAADVDENRFKLMIRRRLDFAPEFVCCHKADELYPVVSAASIVAKVCRDAEILKIENEMHEPVGSGYASDPKTIAFLERWTRERGDLPPHTRRSWIPAKKAKVMAQNSKLYEWSGP